MSDRYVGKDGLERDIAKLKYEWKIYKKEMSVHWDTFKEARTIVQRFHKGTNLFVESCRASAYFFGHVAMIYFTLNTVAWGINAAAWVYFLS